MASPATPSRPEPADGQPGSERQQVATDTTDLIDHGSDRNGWRLRTVETDLTGVDDVLQRIADSAYTASMIRSVPHRSKDLDPSPLCEYCADWIAKVTYVNSTTKSVNYLASRRLGAHSQPQMKQGASEGTCHFCRILCTMLSQFQDGEDKNYRRIGTSWNPVESVPGVSHLCIEFDNVVSKRGNYATVVRCKDMDVLPSHSIAGTNNSSTSWALAKHWIQQCKDSHKACQLPSQQRPRSLPTRLIDLGPEDQAIRPRLCYSAHLPVETKYTTLSHRWTTTGVVRLTLDNHDVWCQGLPVPKLSQTFVDAMEAAKCLGVRYVWIDSICIIQDSTEDWLHEAARMADVYENSLCNFMAPVGGHGLFVSRDPRDLQLCVATAPGQSWWKRSEQYYYFPESSFMSILRNELLRRGWVIQEYTLAPRLLHFGEDQMYWECRELRASERLPTGTPGTRLEKPYVHSGNGGDTTPALSQHPEETSSEPLSVWSAIVERYSQSELTFPEKDKLTALSGIAKRVGIRSEYLAGLWKDDLMVQLLWSGPTALGLPETFQAPSWSWASVNGRISMQDAKLADNEKVVAHVLDAHVECAGDDPMGPVRSGRLRLRGCLAPVGKYAVPEVTEFGQEYTSDAYEKSKIQLDYIGQGHGPDPVDRGTVDGKPVEPRFYLFLVKVGSADGAEDDREARGIVLEATGTTPGEAYRRGTFRYSRGTEESFRVLLDLFNGSMAAPSPDDYHCVSEQVAPVWGLPMYEITVV